MATTLEATTFRNSERSFLEALDAHGIKYNHRVQLTGVPMMAAGITIEIIISDGWGVLAIACLAWAEVRKSRRINVTTKDNKVVWLEGYSADQATSILESAKQIGAIDTEPPKDETEQVSPAEPREQRAVG